MYCGIMYARRKDNIKVDIKEVGREDVDWINVAWDRDYFWDDVNTLMHLLVP